MLRALRTATAALGLALVGVTVATLPASPAVAEARPGPALGVYSGAGSNGVSKVAAFERWSGKPVTHVLDFAADDSWGSITGPSWQLDPWRASGKRLVYSVPLFPKSSSGVPAGSLEACASGSYNTHWTTLGRNLVAKQLEDTIVRPGWEFNGSWFTWTAKDKPAVFAACFRHVVTTMRAVQGQHFAFDWNPNIGPASVPAELAWPGDAYVDYIGLDVYDQSWVPNTYPLSSSASAAQKQTAWVSSWNATVNGNHGLAFWSNFARQHGKQLSMPEWGLTVRPDGHGGGDNPYYIEQTLAWLRDPANNVAYALYFDFDAGDGTHKISRTDNLFATAAARYKALLSTPPTTPAPTTPAPTTPRPTTPAPTTPAPTTPAPTTPAPTTPAPTTPAPTPPAPMTPAPTTPAPTTPAPTTPAPTTGPTIAPPTSAGGTMSEACIKARGKVVRNGCVGPAASFSR